MGHGDTLSNITLEDIPEHHPVRQAARAWIKLSQEAVPPSWRSFQPQYLARCLEWVMVLKQQDDGRLKYVISGEGCNQLFQVTYQGKYFGEDLPEEAIKARQQQFDAARKNPAIALSMIKLPVEGREFIEVYRGLFPFCRSSEEADVFMVVIAPVSNYLL